MLNSNKFNLNNLHENICETIPIGFIVIDSDLHIHYINSQAKKFLRLKEDITHVSELPSYLNYLKKKISNLKPKKVKYDIFFNVNNKLRYFEFYVNSVAIEGEEYKYLTFLDKTDDLKKIDVIKSMQDDLFQFKNLAAMGTMISGIAHELNNPISGISMSSQLAENSLKQLLDSLSIMVDLPEEIFRECLETISYSLSELEHVKLNTTRAAKLVGGLLNYSKKEKLELELCNLSDIIDETLRLTKYQPVFNNSEIEIVCPDNIEINCDRVKIQQVLYNVVKNAVESINETDKKDGMVKINCKQEDQYVIITIIDNGAGIKSTDLGQLFTPFFTTKGPKGGSGLGLSISYRMIERHGGKIAVESKIDVGSSFIITLPRNIV